MPAPTIEELIDTPDDELTIKDILRGIAGMRNDLSSRLDNIEEKLGDFDRLKQDVSDVKQDCQEIRSRVDGIEAAGDAFPANLSLLVLNLPADENEDEDTLTRDVKALLEDGLEVAEVEVTAVQRIPPRTYAAVANEGVNEAVNDGGNARTGVVKVRLESLEQKIRCLRNKLNLQGKPDFTGVQVRNCEDHASRLNRLNMDTLLRQLGRRDDFRFTGSGRLLTREGRPSARGDHGRPAGDGNRQGSHPGGDRQGSHPGGDRQGSHPGGSHPGGPNLRSGRGGGQQTNGSRGTTGRGRGSHRGSRGRR